MFANNVKFEPRPKTGTTTIKAIYIYGPTNRDSDRFRIANRTSATSRPNKTNKMWCPVETVITTVMRRRDYVRLGPIFKVKKTQGHHHNGDQAARRLHMISIARPWVPISSLLTHMAYLLPFLSYLSDSNNVSAGPPASPTRIR